MQPTRPLLPLADPRLLAPRSVLLWGDPALPEARILAHNLAKGGFRGRLLAYGMAPDGFAALPAPETADLVLLALPAPALPEALRRLAPLGIGGAVVPVAMQGLSALVAETGVRCLGAGSFGIAVPSLGLNATLSPRPVPAGRIALIGQSASLARAVIGWAAEEGVGFSHLVGLGANDDLGFASMLDLIARDPAVGAVLLDLRRIKLRRAFVSAARAAARTRPVAALRPGVRAEAGEEGARVLDAALHRAGVIRLSNLEGFLAAAETLGRSRRHRPPPAPGAPTDRVAILGSGAGLAFLAADAVAAAGARLAVLDAAAPALALLLPAGSRIGNPLILPEASGPRLAEAAAALAALPEVDQVVAVHAPAPEEETAATEAAFAAAAAANRGAPILVGWCGADGGRRLSATGVAAFPTPEAAVSAALLLAEERRIRAAAAELPPREVLELSPDRAAVAQLFAALRAEGRPQAREDEALAVFAAYGLPVLPLCVAADPAAAAEASAAIGGRVRLAILSPAAPAELLEALGCEVAAGPEVAAAAEGLAARLAAAAPGAAIAGFLLRAVPPEGTDLRLRLEEDAMFGPWIGLAPAGAAAATEEAVDLPPLNRALALALIGRARLVPRLPPPAAEALAAALVALSALAVDFPEIALARIAPLRITQQGVVAIGGALRLRPAGQAGVLAIAPYPAHLAEEWVAPDGRRLLLRPVRPEDAEAHRAFFARLSPEDVRFRFFAPMQELPAELTARLTQIDYDREMAFIATDGERTVGVARLVRDPAGREGEFALVVEPAWKGKGLGRRLMQKLFAWAEQQGMVEITGHVLAENAPMLAFCRALGFTLRRLPQEPELIEVRRRLGPAPETPAAPA